VPKRPIVSTISFGSSRCICEVYHYNDGHCNLIKN
jgi:hypothetical protein